MSGELNSVVDLNHEYLCLFVEMWMIKVRGLEESDRIFIARLDPRAGGVKKYIGGKERSENVFDTQTL